MKILAVGAHPDDIEIGCGATLARHVREGDEIAMIHVTNGLGARQWPGSATDEEKCQRKDAVQHSKRTLGAQYLLECGLKDQRLEEYSLLHIVKIIESTIKDWRPEIVYTHFFGDLNRDHSIVSLAVQTAFRPRVNYTPEIRTFEVLSTTEIGTNVFSPNLFVSVSDSDISKKAGALAGYDELPHSPHPRSWTAINALMTLRGASVGTFSVEAFVTLRRLIR